MHPSRHLRLHRGASLGILIEHYAGALPLWLAPVQVAVLPLADRHNEAAQ